jgi:hypothetical protein
MKEEEGTENKRVKKEKERKMYTGWVPLKVPHDFK